MAEIVENRMVVDSEWEILEGSTSCGDETMVEMAPDRMDREKYEAELQRMHRHDKRLAAAYEREEIIREEKEIENAGD